MKNNYLVACGLALGAAVLCVVPGPTADEGQNRTILLVVGVAAVMVFGLVIYKMSDNDAPPTSPRIVKMTYLWLAFAILLGASLLEDVWDALAESNTGDLSWRQWSIALLGLSVIGAAIWRLVLALRTR